MSDQYLGEIRMVAFDFAPYGWALCGGQLLPISQNNALFALLGTNYGGTGVSTFGLPNLQGRSPVGVGTGVGLAPIVLGETGGAEQITLTTSQMPLHTHTASVVGGGGTSTVSISIPATTNTANPQAVPGPTMVLGPGASSGHTATVYSTSTPNTNLLPFNASVTTTAPVIANATTGSSLPFDNRNPYIGLTFIIALQGVYPTRG
ncbi:phage tail protein [Burkholderia plantarii]|uniref:phage tail protein n=1 Tax=Burkholderia plantarii TaxID=41899 RepID=UPI0018DCFB99|nr:tail fiber protein [Burkholderia plantarii]MBI0329758.1 phage tail protein [Burkholderia plantarii]